MAKKLVIKIQKKCPACDSDKGYIARVQHRGDCFLDSKGNWVKDLAMDDTEIYGPYVCRSCWTEFDELPS